MPENIDIKLLIGLKPEQIINYLKRKGYKISWNWQDTWKEAHTKAFTVAKAMKLDILSDIRNELQKAIDNGLTYQQFKENLKPILKAKGWWGKVKAKDAPSDFPLPEDVDPEKEVLLGSPWRLKTIYRTNIDVAYASGHYKAMMDNIEDRPYWMYNAVLDSNTRPSHRALHGKVFRADDPIWDKIYPPNDHGCRCSVIPLDDDDLKEMNITPPSRLPNEEAEKLMKKINPGKGWDYNPGKSALEFDNDFGTFKVYPLQPDFSNYNRKKAKDIDDSYYVQSPGLINPDDPELTTIIKKEFNIDEKNYGIIDTVLNDKVFFSLNDFDYLLNKNDQRIKFLKFIKPTLQNPYEAYLTLYQSDKGFVEYRKTYIGLFQDKSKKKYLVVLRERKDSFVLWNAYPAKNIDDYRKGQLIYYKE
ncbi:MAG: minor capsid protein [Ignavibacterium sp.]|jgi:SPP1 gp7 family putative phage head morphogenesis protein|uniref:phage minor head protein n=1 Tax=Ignavibacterium sp. TaxID=2651167 RepID=UPI0032983EE4